MTPLEEFFYLFTEKPTLDIIYRMFELTHLHPELRHPIYTSGEFTRWVNDNSQWLGKNLTRLNMIEMRKRMGLQ